MAIVRQMAELYLRGSLANLTMANLTEEEKEHCQQITEYVANHPEMARHRSQVIRELGDTIGADYKDNQAAAADYQIAVWRGVVHLFYHRYFTFRCRACGQSHYLTQRRKPKAIDRVQVPCPNCRKVEVVTSGDTDLAVGQHITHEEFQDSYKHLVDGQEAPTCKSTIDYIPGEKRYDDPNKIIEDDRQLAKFFGEFVWNYFRQQLRENSRKEHRKAPQKIVGRVDEVITQEIVSLCNKLKIHHSYCPRTQPEKGYWTIGVIGLQTPPEFTIELAELRDKARRYGVRILLTDITIKVKEEPAAPTIESYVVKPEHVLMVDNGTSDDENECFTVDQISFRTVKAAKMELENHVATVESSDVMRAVRDALPDGDCRKVFDIMSQQGEIYDEFSKEYGDKKPRVTHIARFLGTTSRTVNTYCENIRVVCLANHLVPSD